MAHLQRSWLGHWSGEQRKDDKSPRQLVPLQWLHLAARFTHHFGLYFINLLLQPVHLCVVGCLVWTTMSSWLLGNLYIVRLLCCCSVRRGRRWLCGAVCCFACSHFVRCRSSECAFEKGKEAKVQRGEDAVAIEECKDGGERLLLTWPWLARWLGEADDGPSDTQR